MSFGLTSTGYTPRRAAEWLTIIRDDFEARLDALGLPSDVDWTRRSLEAIVTANLAERLGDADEVLQGTYDGMDIDNATDRILDSLVLMVGVPRLPATYSSSPILVTGTAGTVYAAGNIVEGGGTDDRARWIVQADVTVGGGGTVTAAVQAEDLGAIEASPGQIDKIVTPVSGITAITNLTAATAGRDLETDAELRARRLLSLARNGAGSTAAILAALLEIDGVTSAVVLENDRPTNQVVSGKTLVPNCVNAILFPNPLTTAAQQSVIEAIYSKLTAGIRAYGTDVSGTATAADGFQKTIEFDYGTEVSKAVAVTVVLDSGFVIGDVDAPLQELITDYFATLTVGQAVADLDINALAATVPGIFQATSLIGGASSFTPEIHELVTLSGTPTVTT